MRSLFPGRYRPTEAEFDSLWKTCVFVLDTNVLLDPYRVPEKVRNEILEFLRHNSERIWIPHQVAQEYQNKRHEVVAGQLDVYHNVAAAIRDAEKKLKTEVKDKHKKHTLLNTNSIWEKIETFLEEIVQELNEQKQKHPEWSSHEQIHNELADLLEGKVGSPYSLERLQEIYTEGANRYSALKPPGYIDGRNKKEEAEKYGDLVLWFQILDFAKANRKPIIFVTDDGKEDWWWEYRGRTIGPRYELVEEINSNAGAQFYMYSTSQFLEHASKYLNQPYSQETITTLRELHEMETTTGEESEEEIAERRYQEYSQHSRARIQAAQRDAEMAQRQLSPEQLERDLLLQRSILRQSPHEQLEHQRRIDEQLRRQVSPENLESANLQSYLLDSGVSASMQEQVARMEEASRRALESMQSQFTEMAETNRRAIERAQAEVAQMADTNRRVAERIQPLISLRGEQLVQPSSLGETTQQTQVEDPVHQTSPKSPQEILAKNKRSSSKNVDGGS